MPGISYALLDFVTGGPILDLPVRKGADWSSQLGRADALSCSVNLRDAENAGLDLRAATEPNKTLMIARTDDDVILAWGLIGDDGREWDEDKKRVTLTAAGIEDTWLGRNPIAPATALTAALTVLDDEGFRIPNPALDTTISGVSHGTIGKRLVEQLLAWPGAPTVFDLPADEPGTREQSYSFASFKSVGSALADLTKQEHGPDFAFRAQRSGDGLTLRYAMIHGSEAEPRIGTHVGRWPIGGLSPVTGLKISDAVAAGAAFGWMSSGKQSADVLMSRVIDAQRVADGYPPISIIDTSHSDVTVQKTLDSYNRENVADAGSAIRDLSFKVRADAAPSLGNYAPGDMVTLDAPEGHPWLDRETEIRITSISGDEVSKSVSIGCVILDD